MDIFISVHDQDFILKLEKNKIFRYLREYRYIFLGYRSTDKLASLKDKVIVARDLPDNIEHQKQLFDYTGWYAIIKNNLITSDTVCVIHYDCFIFKDFESKIKSLFDDNRNCDFISFQPHLLTCNYFITDEFSKSAVSAIKEIYKIDIFKYINEAITSGDKYWPGGGSFACKKTWIKDYIDWVEPLKPILLEDKMAAHNIERTMKFFNIIKGIHEFYLTGVMEHIFNGAHDQVYQDPIQKKASKKRFDLFINGCLHDLNKKITIRHFLTRYLSFLFY